MLVYGDQQERADPRQKARQIARRLEAAAALPPGLERHAALVASLVEAGQLLQGIGDLAFEQQGRDGSTPLTDRLAGFLLELGTAVCRSWTSGFADCRQLPTLGGETGWPDQVSIKLAEGFAFYAVYPEAYAEAARKLELRAPPRVIGIRSIGTSLAAVVAAALGAPAPVTVRPFGDPSARKIAIDPALEAELLSGEAHNIVVDEGPGQSGSSFAAVGSWLKERGVPDARVALITSHGGAPGPAASDEVRRWWQGVQRATGDFEDDWPAMVTRWAPTLVGPLDGPAEDLSAGKWRRQRRECEEDWPAAVPAFERRKFIVRASGKPFLVKFAGLGAVGERKLAIAQALAAEKLVPEPVGLMHGFLVERWLADGAPLARDDKPVRQIGHYLGTRARLLPAARDSGASADELLRMIRRNASLEFGDGAAQVLDSWALDTAEMERRMVRVRTDSKLDRHEWVRTRAGALLKTDALDHHQGHDLVGCQDLAWDVAGAEVEFGLDDEEAGRLRGAAEQSAGRALDGRLIGFCRLAYLAFRMGQARLAETMISDAGEHGRIRRLGNRYAAELQHLLESSRAATRCDSSVG